MNLVILGATGRTGLPLVKQALDAGHQVTALVRTPSKLSFQNERLSIVQGDILVFADVLRAITPGTDAVICVLAPYRDSPKDFLPSAVEHIVQAMRQNGVRRLLYMTGAGVAMPQDKPTLINHLIKFTLTTMAGDVLAQSEDAVRKIQQSHLDWTILRAPMLNDAPPTGKYRVGWVGVNTGPRLRRADAAAFLLSILSTGDYWHQAPVVSN